MSSDPYLCPNGCNEMIFKTENRVSQYGNMIPLNFYDGQFSKRGEQHVCPKNPKVKKIFTPPYNEKSHDLHEYLRHCLKLHSDGNWYKYHDGKYAGFHSKATPEELGSWNPLAK
jgi:hypothetical protein